jgi:PIN domain nuclease of toxin-antitoxin system
MRLLLDTHILLAVLEQRTAKLAPGVRRLLADPEGEFHVIVASLWEIAIKWRSAAAASWPRPETAAWKPM